MSAGSADLTVQTRRRVLFACSKVRFSRVPLNTDAKLKRTELANLGVGLNACN